MNRKLVRLSCVAAVIASAAVFLVSPAAAGEKVLLRSKYESGKKSYLQNRSVIIQDMTTPMGAMKVSMNRMSGTVQEVKSASSSGTELGMTMDRMSFAMNVPMMGDLKFDSDIPTSEDAPNLRTLLKPMLGEELVLTLDGKNVAQSVKGVTEMLAKVEKANGGNPFFQSFKGGFNEEHVIQGMNQLNVTLLPNKEVAVGDTWTGDVSEALGQMPGKVVFECAFKLDKIGEHKGRRAAFVTFSSKMVTYEKGKSSGMPVPELSVTDGELTGDYIFDIDNGVVIKRTMETRFDIAAKPMEGDEANPMGNFSLKATAKHMDQVKSMKAREKEQKKNAKLAAEIKAKEDAEFDEDDSEDSEDGKDSEE